MNKLFTAAIGISLLSISGIASAGTITCGGTIDKLAYHANDSMMIKLSSMNRAVMFCSPQNEWTVPGTSYKTGAETCKLLYSTFLAAKISGQVIDVMYFDGDEVPESCTTFEPWKRANIRYYSL